MDIHFYLLLTLACLVLLLAMWVCAASDTPKWGPDLTLELPPHLLQEALFKMANPSKHKTSDFKIMPVPSAPSEYASDPLLSNEHPMGETSYNPPAPYKLNTSTAIQVLPRRPPPPPPKYKPRPTYSSFTEGEPV